MRKIFKSMSKWVIITSIVSMPALIAEEEVTENALVEKKVEQVQEETNGPTQTEITSEAKSEPQPTPFEVPENEKRILILNKPAVEMKKTPPKKSERSDWKVSLGGGLSNNRINDFLDFYSIALHVAVDVRISDLPIFIGARSGIQYAVDRVFVDILTIPFEGAVSIYLNEEGTIQPVLSASVGGRSVITDGFYGFGSQTYLGFYSNSGVNFKVSDHFSLGLIPRIGFLPQIQDIIYEPYLNMTFDF